MSVTSLLCARVNFYRACRRNVKNAGQPLTLCFMRPAYMRPVVPSMGNTRFSCVGFWAKCYPEMEVRCQNARFRFMPCTEYGAAVRKKQGSCIHLPDGFGTGFSPDNSEKPFSGLPFPSFSRPKNVFHELCPFLCGEFFFAFKRLKNHSLEIKC